MPTDSKSIREKLADIQLELDVPKSQYNSYGGFNYRSCEDILEALKPIAKSHGCVVTLTDEIEMVGDRYYVKATATLTDFDVTVGQVSATAYAREAESRKGSDVSQVSGAASTYANKYALNALFCIDDSKDADADPEPSGQFVGACTACGRQYMFDSKTQLDNSQCECGNKQFKVVK